MSRTWGFIFVLLSGAGFGFLGIFGRFAFQSGLTVGEFLTFRFLLAGLILWLWALIFRRHLIKLSLQQIGISVALGVFGYAVFSTFYFESIKSVSVPLAVMLLFTFPIFVNLGAHFILKERMSKNQVLSLVIAMIGLGMLVWGPLVVESSIGILMGLGAGFTYSIYVLASGKYQQNVPPISSSLYVITSAAIVLGLFHQPDLGKLAELTTEQAWIIIGIATVSTIAPLTLFLAGLQRLPSSQASIVVMSEPVVAAIAAWFILGETLSSFQLLGGIIVIAALILNTRSKA